MIVVLELGGAEEDLLASPAEYPIGNVNCDLL